MRLPPTDILLRWPPPNYANPVTRGPALAIVNYVFISITIITVALRLYTRIAIKRWFGIDDVFIIIALAFTIGLTVIVLLANQKFGWDRHVWDIPLDQIAPASKIAMSAKIIFASAATFTRLSLHCFYYRLVKDSGKTWFRWLIHINVAYTLAIFISFPFIAVFLCNPVKAYWEISAGDATCLDEGVATMICGVISCVADFATTITPMPLVYGLRMPWTQRVAVAFLFGLGIIVTVAGAVRTWYIYRALFGKEYDQTWYSYPLWIAAAVEIDLGVICASAPVLKPLLAKIPFSLTSTFTSGISFRKSSEPSPSYQQGTPHGSRSVNPSTIGSKRKTEGISSIPELADDRGKSYELKKWDDFETGTTSYNTTQESSEGVLIEDEAAATKGFRGLWKKIAPGENDRDNDMTITRTDEVELEISSASNRNSKRFSRALMPRISVEPPSEESKTHGSFR